MSATKYQSVLSLLCIFRILYRVELFMERISECNSCNFNTTTVLFNDYKNKHIVNLDCFDDDGNIDICDIV